ncbi:polyphosphate kinase 1 [Flavobacterium sp. HNIBRBA15423]|uniref:polyphosphate kinase 1 n=1 Tax=Flavobacterium sp. HNIBRBA15423 TaxID=3458683 RepID=UPI004044F6C4
MNNTSQNKYIDREKSWLTFNARVLQEAADESVPLLDRLRFLGIFSNNLDEFFRVRYAAIRRMRFENVDSEKILGGISAETLLKEITEIVIDHQSESLRILSEIEQKLEKENIFIVNEKQISKEQEIFIRDYFIQTVSPAIVTIMLNDLDKFPLLKDTSGYLAIKLVMNDESQSSTNKEKTNKEKEIRYAVVEIPSTVNRFVVLPTNSEKQYIILLDDVIRLNLNYIFNIFNYESISAHMIKITRDAQLEFDSDLSKSFIEKVSDSVKERRVGEPVRFVYDQAIGKDTLAFLLERMHIDSSDSIIPGGRYHNRRDYMSFPNLGRYDLLYKKNPPLSIPGLNIEGSILEKIKQKDYLLNAPYQSFSYIIKFLREAALDPKVVSIKITLYRLAKNSQIISSLINAAKNGKKVTVQIELKARFDEASNISYAEQMQTEGINLIFGIKGLKVHSKICIVERIEDTKIKRYGFISTGNFNENSAKVYTDVTLFTSNTPILKDVSKVFDFFEINYKVHRYKHLFVSPHYTRSKFLKLIDREIMNALSGKEAYIKLRMNSVSDFKMIDKLYEASNAGVKIQMIIRGICCLIPGIKGMSENIEAISIVDNYLEHSRVYIFSNNNNPEVYISSADFMTRNIDARVEVTCPIYDEDIKNELMETFEIGWKANIKARIHSESLKNEYRKIDGEKPFRAQLEMYNYYKEKLTAISKKAEVS